MTYEELKIQLDLNESIDILKFIGKKLKTMIGLLYVMKEIAIYLMTMKMRLI